MTTEYDFEQLRIEGFMRDLFNTIKEKITPNKSQLDKRNFIDYISSIQATASTLYNGFTTPQSIGYIDDVFKGVVKANDTMHVGLTAYKLMVKELSPTAKAIETKHPTDTIARVLKMVIADIDDIEKSFGYLLGVNSDKVVDVNDLKVSATLIIGYISHINVFVQWVFDLFAALTSYDTNSKTFLKYQKTALLMPSAIRDIGGLINSMIVRKPSDTIHNLINKLKTSQNDVTIAVPDENESIEIDKYLPENIFDRNDAFWLTGFEDALTGNISTIQGLNASIVGYIPNLILGVGRTVFDVQRFFHEYNKGMRDWTATKIDQLILLKDRTADPEEIDRLNKLIGRYTDKNAEYNKKIKDYLQKH